MRWEVIVHNKLNKEDTVVASFRYHSDATEYFNTHEKLFTDSQTYLVILKGEE